MITYVAVFSLAVLISLLSTRRVMGWAKKNGWMDKPDSARKLHKAPVPRIGGMAIYISILLSIGLLSLFPTVVASAFRLDLTNAAKLLTLSGMMLLIGLWDDIKGLKPWAKFAAQITVALAAWTIGFRILFSWDSEGTVFSLGVMSLPLTVLWIVGVTNAFNLIDGVDGLSAGAALFATGAMLVASLQQGQLLSTVILLALAGSITGFLRFNFSPASIFLGDSGSLLLGSMLSLLAVEYSHKSTTAFAIGLPIVALGLPVLDTAMVVLRRFLNGKPIFLGDRRHIHHVLIERGLKPRNAVILLYGVCGLFGLFSLLFLNPSGRTTGIVLVILVLSIFFGIYQLHCFEFRELRGYLIRSLRYQRKYIIGNVKAGKMIDGFHEARSLPDMLASLSSFLDEMEFSCVEVRVPVPDGDCAALHLNNWTMAHDGAHHCLYRWTRGKEMRAGESEIPAGLHPSENKGLNTHFRLEFVFKVPVQRDLSALPLEARKGIDIGRLTFFHPTTARLPVSALCLLGRQVWMEFGKAVRRITAPSAPAEKNPRTDSKAPVLQIPHGSHSTLHAPIIQSARTEIFRTGTRSGN